MGRDLSAALAVALGLLLALSGPVLAADSDNDGLRDGFERRLSLTGPYDRDSDGDGLIDGVEDEDGDKLGNRGEQRFGTDPTDPDTDGDGILDGDEDHDGDGRSNAREQDQRRVPRDVRPSLRAAPRDANRLERWCGVTMGNATVKTCRLGRSGSDTTIVLMGDSHAHALLEPFKRAAEQQGWELITLIKGACIPLLGLGNANQYRFDRGRSCRAWKNAALRWLNGRNEPPDLIVLAFSDSYQLANGGGRTLPRAQWPSLWAAGLERTLARLPKASRALILGDVPRNRDNPLKCLRRDPSDMSACTSAKETEAQRPEEAALREAATAGGARFGSLYDQICPYDPCQLVHGDVLLWRDRAHLTTTFAIRLTPAVRRMLIEALA